MITPITSSIFMYCSFNLIFFFVAILPPLLSLLYHILILWYNILVSNGITDFGEETAVEAE